MSAEEAPALAHARVGITLDNEREVQALHAWFKRWGPRIRMVSEQGCACCQDAWDVQAPAQALQELPVGLLRPAPLHRPPVA